MKLLLLRVLLQRRARDEGFTLPMVIALGLVMILLGIVNIVKSSEENLNTIAQSQRIDALAVAELGAAQYRQFFDRNRALILQNRNEWTTTANVCDAITDTTNGWANNDNDAGAVNVYDSTMWRSISLNEVELGTDLNNDGDSDDTDQSINIGSYKIVDYEFDLDGITGDTDTSTAGIQYDLNDDALFNLTSDDLNDIDADGESDARGILTIKARTPGDDASEAQIEYEIPVRINTGDLDNLSPALWINQSNITTAELGTLNITNNGNLVISHRVGDGVVTWNGSNLNPCDDPADLTISGNTISVVSDPRGVPPITDLQAFFANSDGSGLPSAANNSLLDPTLRLGQPLAGVTAFDDGDPDGDGNLDNDPVYYYTPVGSLTLNSDLRTDGIADVIVYINGDLTINSSATNIGNNDPNNTSSNLQISTSGNVTVNTGGGTINITALIHAPNGTVTFSGGGTVNVTGAIWANDFDATGVNVNITPDNTDTTTGGVASTEPSYGYYRIANDRDPKPITQPPTNWKTEEVD